MNLHADYEYGNIAEEALDQLRDEIPAGEVELKTVEVGTQGGEV